MEQLDLRVGFTSLVQNLAQYSPLVVERDWSRKPDC